MRWRMRIEGDERACNYEMHNKVLITTARDVVQLGWTYREGRGMRTRERRRCCCLWWTWKSEKKDKEDRNKGNKVSYFFVHWSSLTDSTDSKGRAWDKAKGQRTKGKSEQRRKKMARSIVPLQDWQTPTFTHNRYCWRFFHFLRSTFDNIKKGQEAF